MHEVVQYQGISTEALVMIVVAFVGATLWVVSAIYGVRDAVKDLSIDLREDIAKIDERVTDLENEVWPE